MYWRVRNFGPEHLIRQYGVHAALAASLFFNLVLFTTRPAQTRRVPHEIKQSTEELGRNVACQLLDTSYLTYAENTQKLLTTKELHESVINKLRAAGQIPKNNEELKANVRSLTSEKSVVSVRIDSVVSGDPLERTGYVPIDVSGMVARHSASGADENRFHFRFLMGMRATGEVDSSVNSHSRYAAQGNNQQQVLAPIVVDIQEVAS